MEQIQNLQQTADTVLDKTITVEFDIVRPTFIDRIKKRKVKTFHVRRSTLSTLLLFSNLILDLVTEATTEKKSFAECLKAISSDAILTAKLVAILLTNSEEIPDNKLVEWLVRNLDNDDLHRTLIVLVYHSRIENFMNSIILLKGMSLLKTKEMIAFEDTISGMQSED